MTQRMRISSIDKNQINQSVSLNGWVRTRRDSKGISFIQLYDGSNQNGIQVVADEVLENYQEVLELFFSYVVMLNQEGYKEYLFEESTGNKRPENITVKEYISLYHKYFF